VISGCDIRTALSASDTWSRTRVKKLCSKRVLVFVAGWSFILFGIVGVILPVMHGTVFIILGLVILSSEYAWARLLLSKLRRRFPKIGRVVDAAAAKAATWLKRSFARTAVS